MSNVRLLNLTWKQSDEYSSPGIDIISLSDVDKKTLSNALNISICDDSTIEKSTSEILNVIEQNPTDGIIINIHNPVNLTVARELAKTKKSVFLPFYVKETKYATMNGRKVFYSEPKFSSLQEITRYFLPAV